MVSPFFLFRKVLSKCVILFSVYIYPFSQSVSAVVRTDEQAIAKLLVYWTVITLVHFAQYLLFFFYPQRLLESYPPEINAVFMLWLTLPQFDGATMIYKDYIQPFFLQHEEAVDEIIKDVSSQVSAFTMKHSQNIAYQLLISKDGLGPAILSNASKLITFMDGFDFKSLTSSSKSVSLSKKILQDFTFIMQEGIVMKAGPVPQAGRDSIRGSGIFQTFADFATKNPQSTGPMTLKALKTSLIYVNLSLHDRNSNYFLLKCIEDDSKYLLPIILVKSINIFDPDGVDVLPNSSPMKTLPNEEHSEIVEITFYSKILLFNPLDNYRGRILASKICLDMPEKDCEGFVGGMQVFSTSVRTRALRKLTKLCDILSKARKRKFLYHWNRCIQEESSYLESMVDSSLQALPNPMQMMDWSTRK